MKLGSLCTGSGILDHTVARIFGAEPAWGCESDRVAAKVAAHNLQIPIYPAVGDVFWENVEPVDIIAAGWPCQPFSLAGKKKGADDDRAIWPAIGRTIRLIRPRYVVLENVPGIFGSGEFHRVITTLADLGYEFRWTTLHASEAGAPHRRTRVFILGCHEGFPKRAGVTAPLILPVKPMGYLLPTPAASDGERSSWQNHNGESAYRLTDFMLDHEKMQKVEPALKRWQNISRRKMPAQFDTTLRGTQRTSVAFVEWVMGWPKGWVSELPDDNWMNGRSGLTPIPKEYALRVLGNGVVPQQVQMALGRLFNYREEPRIYGIE